MADDVRLRVSVVQTESSLDPAVNRARLGEAAELAPASDLVVFPEAFARDFGKPGSDLADFAEPLDGPFVTRLREVSDQHDVAVLAGMFERSGDGGLPFNTLVLADRGGSRRTARSTSTTRSATASPTPWAPVSPSRSWPTCAACRSG